MTEVRSPARGIEAKHHDDRDEGDTTRSHERSDQVSGVLHAAISPEHAKSSRDRQLARERQRLCRARWKAGLLPLPPIAIPEIDSIEFLMRAGYLAESDSEDRARIARAVESYLADMFTA